MYILFRMVEVMKKEVKKNLINFAKKHHWFLSFLRFVRNIIKKNIYIYYYLTSRVEDKRVIFESFMGRQYSCSPKAIYLELLNNPKYKGYKFVWAFEKTDNFDFLLKNKNTIIVKYGSRNYYKEYARCKYWITNSRLPEAIIRKKQQKYIQCWHGTPLKKLGFDIEVTGGNVMNSVKDIQDKYLMDSKRYSYMISPSQFCTDKFISAFKLKDSSIVKQLGYPRNDFLINHKKNDANRIKKELGIPKDKKIILYAPTWRDNQHQSGLGYTYSLNIDFGKLKKEFSNDYIILFRTHYFVANSINLEQYKDFVINVSDYGDVNDLYIVSDILITDYSSVFFDFANLRRPIIFYMYDYEEYKNKLRDFYLDFEELPGPIIKKQKELINEIKKIGEYNDKYQEKYNKFNQKYTYLDDGKASKRVVQECIK